LRFQAILNKGVLDHMAQRLEAQCKEQMPTPIPHGRAYSNMNLAVEGGLDERAVD
jgi:hypothetical protein